MTENMAAKGASKEGAATKTFWADHTVPRRAKPLDGKQDQLDRTRYQYIHIAASAFAGLVALAICACWAMLVPPAAADTQPSDAMASVIETDVPMATVPSAAAANGLDVVDLIGTPTVHARYGAFVFGTTSIDLTAVNHDGGFAETVTANGDRRWTPTVKGATFTIPHVGRWTKSDGGEHWLNAALTFDDWRRGYLQANANGYLNVWAGKKGDGSTDHSFAEITVQFRLDDGNLPDGLMGVTGFTDLDGDNNVMEGWELLSGFDAAYVRGDAHMKPYGTNGWVGTTDANAHIADEHGMKHYLGATFVGHTIRVRYSISGNDQRGSAFYPLPSTMLHRLSYDLNGGSGTDPISAGASVTDTAAGPGCMAWHERDSTVTLATAQTDHDCWDAGMIGKTGKNGAMRFLGWSEQRSADVTTQEEMSKARIVSTTTVPASGRTVYAVWAHKDLPLITLPSTGITADGVFGTAQGMTRTTWPVIAVSAGLMMAWHRRRARNPPASRRNHA